MAFAVQDDDGAVADANSYASVAEFNEHHLDRAAIEAGDYEDADVQAALVLATDYIDGRYSFVGYRMALDQTTEWPRSDAEDASGYLRVGLPAEIVAACCELALAELKSPGSLFPAVTQDETGQAVRRRRTKVDVVETEVEYFAASQRSPVFGQVDRRLVRAGLVASGRSVARA